MTLVGPYNFDDANTAQIAITFKWRVVAPTGGVAVAPVTDFPGGVYPTGTGSIAANALQRRYSFNIEIVPNLKPDGDRYFDVEIYDVLPANSQLSNVRVRTKIADDDVSTAPTLTLIYGPLDNAADSPTLDFESNRQMFKRTYRSGAPKWKAQVGGVRANVGGQYTYLSVLMDDSAKKAYIVGKVYSAGGDGTAETITVDYAAHTFKADEVTELWSDANGLRYMIGDEVLWSVTFAAAWRGKTIDNATLQAEMPGRFGAANAHEAVANGIAAYRIGAVQA